MAFILKFAVCYAEQRDLPVPEWGNNPRSIRG